MYTAYFERLTDDGHALFLIEQLKKEYHVSPASLPEGSTVGMWFLVEIENDVIISMQIDTTKTITMQNRINDRMQRLKSNKKSRFKRKQE